MSGSMQLRLVVVMALGAAHLGCSRESVVDPGPPQIGVVTRLEARSRTLLTGTVASEVSPVPMVIVTDMDHKPVQGIEVSFSTGGESGAVVTTSMRTGLDGTASAGTWRLGTTAGNQTLRAATAALPTSSVVFTAIATAAPAQTITALDSAQTTPAGSIIWFRARVADAFNNPVPGAMVTLDIESGGGSVESSVVSTDLHGIVRTEWRAGTAGENSLTASLHGLAPARLTATAWQALSYYELELMAPYLTPVSAWIALRDSSRFAAAVNGLHGRGEYTTSGGGITFTYSDDFLRVFQETMDWSPYPPFARQEIASITPDVIVVRRCYSDECWELNWTYRRKGR